MCNCLHQGSLGRAERTYICITHVPMKQDGCLWYIHMDRSLRSVGMQLVIDDNRGDKDGFPISSNPDGKLDMADGQHTDLWPRTRGSRARGCRLMHRAGLPGGPGDPGGPGAQGAPGAPDAGLSNFSPRHVMRPPGEPLHYRECLKICKYILLVRPEVTAASEFPRHGPLNRWVFEGCPYEGGV